MLAPDGCFVVVNGDTPAAGNDASVSFSAAERAVLLGVAFTLTASVAVATRTPVLQVADGTGITIVDACAGVNTTASQAIRYAYNAGLASWNSANNVFASGPCPRVQLDQSTTLTVHVEALQAADAITDVRVLLWQYPVGAERVT